MNTVRNSVPIEAVRARRASAVGGSVTSVGGGAVIGGQGTCGQGTARMVARRVRRHQAPVARFSAAAGELILPEHEADGGRVRGQRRAKQRLHDLGLLAQPLEQRRHVGGRAALEGEAVEPQPEIDARLVGRHEVGRAGDVAGLVAEVLRGPGALVVWASRSWTGPSASVWNSGSMRSRVIDANRW